jgi:RpiR family carbohydrate utilization transcriptional regulator
MKLAREAGATVIGLVPHNTAVAQLSAIPIHINLEDNQHMFTPLSSRIAHMVVIDVLAMDVAQLRGNML